MDKVGTLFLIAVIPALFFGSPGEWFKTEADKDYDKNMLGGGLLSWFLTKLAGVIVWWFILIGLLIAFVIIKAVWRLA